MVGSYHRLNGHEFEPSLGDGEGQGSLECCSPRGCKETDTTEQLNSTKIHYLYFHLHVSSKGSLCQVVDELTSFVQNFLW